MAALHLAAALHFREAKVMAIPAALGFRRSPSPPPLLSTNSRTLSSPLHAQRRAPEASPPDPVERRPDPAERRLIPVEHWQIREQAPEASPPCPHSLCSRIEDSKEEAAAASVEDAISYVGMVKNAFKYDHPAKYRDFLRVMDDFRNQRIGITEVASSVKTLFRESPDLILGFNVFLPKGYKIQVGIDELAAYFVKDINLDDGDGDH